MERNEDERYKASLLPTRIRDPEFETRTHAVVAAVNGCEQHKHGTRIAEAVFDL